ncbi:MAG: tRNA (adenosine(37)-N6)-threonylcarbamoyltransferase complex dimerization subunit type 1 TsaB [Gemmatimonadaceae bacterium]
MSLTLAIDASTYSGSVALVSDGRVIASQTVAMRGDNEERLLPAVAEVLRVSQVAPSAIQCVACGAGPGSFTSLRIAAAIAKGIAATHAAHLLAIPSLALLAMEAARLRPSPIVYVALDAMRGEWFVAKATFAPDGALADISEPTIKSASWLSAVGPGQDGDVLTIAGPGLSLDAAPHARAAAPLLADGRFCDAWTVDVNTWEPRYGRVAEAQARWEAARGHPLASPAQP